MKHWSTADLINEIAKPGGDQVWRDGVADELKQRIVGRNCLSEKRETPDSSWRERMDAIMSLQAKLYMEIYRLDEEWFRLRSEIQTAGEDGLSYTERAKDG